MKYPTPEDPARAPVWENYAVAQAVEASRGHIPEHTLAYGVEVDGTRLRLRFQLSEVTEPDYEDIDDIVGDFEGLVGPDLEVEFLLEVLEWRRLSPHERVRWVYLSRVD
ncbi:hypothetical protein M3147_08470 [Agromyces mediolanus]|uniref:hypothetical protein n=1 Tax=Agromyces mediolanus TaxID=41986 RepID=UPI00203B1D0F|nr:hypothetical protein [Agromyces mediolanus]MCM3657283.1 hypothetical protein [Agromyces mediolanus]